MYPTAVMNPTTHSGVISATMKVQFVATASGQLMATCTTRKKLSDFPFKGKKKLLSDSPFKAMTCKIEQKERMLHT